MNSIARIASGKGDILHGAAHKCGKLSGRLEHVAVPLCHRFGLVGSSYEHCNIGTSQ